MKIITVCVGLASVLAGLSLAAGPLKAATTGEGSHPLRKMLAGRFATFRESLALTDSQKQEIRGVLKGYTSRIKDQWDESKTTRDSMRDAVKEHGADSAEAKAAAKAVGTSAEHRALLIAEIATKVKPILTADQVSKIESAWAEIENLIDARFAKVGE
ncbi:Spy/CpxP family protein refolding chaperone [Haloferula sp. BvORR071]|uniref:Spy/CpxP family protein refolding chaperone n=1 Tax=Haloferula sp. BvORR071 TaxID=1396141 RepID=UPI000558BFA5|nr:Spy/CpxP family protein refolding chaperone [Haloferula sp. BvORR071]